MFTPDPPLKFPPAEQAIADRLMKIVPEIDRTEGYTQPHAVEVARLAEILACQLDLRGHDLTSLLLAALAHDLGERAMKRNYLRHEDPLTWEETLDLWRHPILGEQQSAELNLPRQAQLLIRWHHESWNGEGYPDALAGEAIPLGARILRVADTWCALTCDRPYRPAFDPCEAEEIIAEQAGIELDPVVVQTLLAYLEAERLQAEMLPDEIALEDTLSIGSEEEDPALDEVSDETVIPISPIGPVGPIGPIFEEPPDDPAADQIPESAGTTPPTPQIASGDQPADPDETAVTGPSPSGS